MNNEAKYPAPQADGMAQSSYHATGWVDFETNSSGFFIVNGSATSYKNYDETIWGRAGWRVNSDGLVQLRGLVRRSSGNVTAADVVCQLPQGLWPFWQRRMDGQCAMLAIIGAYNGTPADRGKIQADTVRQASDFLVLDQCTFYVGS